MFWYVRFSPYIYWENYGRCRKNKYFRKLIILSSVFWILLAIDISRMNIYYNKRILTDAMFTCMGEIYLLKDKTFFSRTIIPKIKFSFIIFYTSLNPYWYYLKCNLGLNVFHNSENTMKISGTCKIETVYTLLFKYFYLFTLLRNVRFMNES